jgi:multiple sugar transport system permease protein
MFVEVESRCAGSAPAASAPPAEKPRRGLSRLRALTPYLYLAPAAVFLGVWTYKPLVQTFQLSFYDWNMIPTSPKTPVGMSNYIEVLALPELRQALGNTLVYIGAFLVFSLVLPVIIALASTRVGGRAKTIYQAIIFVPFLVTPVASAAVWRWLFNADSGVIPKAAALGGYELGNVFREPALSLWGIVLIVGWQMLGFGVLVISAGISGISPDYGHAAALDGAKPWLITRKITLPLLSPTLVFMALMTILLSAQWTYPVIDILTQGGPSGASNNIYYLLYEFGFRNFDAGLSAAAGTLFFIAFGIIAAVFVKVSDKLSFYDN